VLRINNGGMASHGGMIGAIVACWIVSRAYGEEKEGRPSTPIPFLHMLDLLCAIAPIGLLLGRIANFVNGELLGRIVTQPADGRAAPWWAVKYPQELLERNDEVVRTPAQELALDRLVEAHTMPGDPTQLAYDQMIRRVQRGDESLAEQLAPLISARHPSQLYQAFVEGVVLFVVLWVIWRKPRKPGVVGCWFLIVYGVGRIATEFWRLPDAHLAHERIMGMSRGQWLSAAMVGFGLVLLPILARRDSEKLGGWVSRKVVP
jgi:phosphatidylglycerol:prolipoprotein diacylglycerol transferase